MSVVRFFQVECDWCGNLADDTYPYSEMVKEHLRKDGWVIGNKAKCPACLGTDPTYWKSWGAV